MNKIILLIVSFSLFVTGCKTTTLNSPSKDPAVIESEDNYVPWWAK